MDVVVYDTLSAGQPCALLHVLAIITENHILHKKSIIFNIYEKTRKGILGVY